MNERYQKHTKPAGKTRKSAAAAKPKRSGATTSSSKKSTSSSAKGKSSSQKSTVFHPPTAEYTRWRKYWWILLGVSIAFVGASWALRFWLEVPVAANAALVAGYAAIAAAIYIDWSKLRKMRQDYNEQLKSGKAPKSETSTAPSEKTSDDDKS